MDEEVVGRCEKHSRSSSPLQNLMERAVVLGHGANQEETSPALASLVNQYASILAAQVRTPLHPGSSSYLSLNTLGAAQEAGSI